MDIFQEGFTQADGNHLEPNHDEPQPSSVAPPDTAHESQHTAPASTLSAQDAMDGETDAPLRGKAATEGMTVDEKKERQKHQNRLAAERSRSKKREELFVLPSTLSTKTNKQSFTGNDG